MATDGHLRYRIEDLPAEYGDGIVVYGRLPLEELGELLKKAQERGLSQLDLETAAKLGALLVVRP